MTSRGDEELGAPSERWLAIDASRGVAMAFVCLSHFATGYFASIGHPERQDLTDRISMLASPAFMLISGSMLGLLSATRSAERFARVRDKLVDRGLFLIIVAHALIVIAHLPLREGPRAWMRWGFLKDTIAGPMGASTRLYNFPILPWLAVYLAGTALGGEMAMRRERGESSVSLVLGIGGASAAVTAVFVVAIAAMNPRALIPAGDIFASLSDLASPFQKLPPAPLYLLGYGGLALVMMGALMWAEEHAIAVRALRAISLVGRASLFVFVLQYYVNFVIVPQLRLPDTPWWPMYFAGSLAAIYLVTAAWMSVRLNRLITVGYPFARARARHDVPSGAQGHASELPTVGV